MARRAFGSTLGASLGSGRYAATGKGVTPPLTSSTAADTATGTAQTDVATAAGTLTTDVAAAVAVLVADGASPTQAHVNTLNTAWGLLATAIATAKTSTDAAKVATAAALTASAPANAVLDIDLAVVTNQNAVKALVDQLVHQVAGSGLATG